MALFWRLTASSLALFRFTGYACQSFCRNPDFILAPTLNLDSRRVRAASDRGFRCFDHVRERKRQAAQHRGLGRIHGAGNVLR